MRCVEKFSKTCAIRATSAIAQDYQGVFVRKWCQRFKFILAALAPCERSRTELRQP